MLIQINTRSLNYLRPTKIILYAIIILVFFFIVAPISIPDKYTPSTSSILYIISCLLGFCLGTILLGAKRQEPFYVKFDIDKLLYLYKLSFILGIISIALKLVDLILYRGVSFANTMIDNHYFANEVQGSIFSVVSAVLVPFVYIPFTLTTILRKKYDFGNYTTSIILLLSSCFATVLFGSRNALFFVLLYMLIVKLYTQVRLNINLKNIMVGVLALIISIYLIALPFMARLETMNISIHDSVATTTGGYSTKVPASDDFKKLLEDTEGTALTPLLFGYSNLTQYFTHAVIEFSEVKEYIDKTGVHLYGRATFAVTVKFVERILGLDSDVGNDISENNARRGIWSTFFFIWYLDFGWLGPFVMIIFGYICEKVWSNIYHSGNILFIPLLAQLTMILLLIFQLNLFTGAGMYSIIIFTLLPFIINPKYQIIHNEENTTHI